MYMATIWDIRFAFTTLFDARYNMQICLGTATKNWNAFSIKSKSVFVATTKKLIGMYNFECSRQKATKILELVLSGKDLKSEKK